MFDSIYGAAVTPQQFLLMSAAALVTAFFGVYLFRRVARKRGFGALAYYNWVIGVLTIILTLIF